MVGLVDYGSTSEGRGDEWSDVDVALFVRDDDLEAFQRDWVSWAGQFGRLLLAYIGGVGHPWAVYEAEPAPLRVDFAFHPASRPEVMQEWPNSPVSAEAMVLYDGTGGQLTAVARQLVGRSLSPDDLARTFEIKCGDFWYYAIRVYGKILRGDEWGARYEYNYIVTGLLCDLLRLEAGAVDRWQVSHSASGIERAISRERLDALNRCIPDASRSDLVRALRSAALLGRDVCASIAAQHQWTWPEGVADRTLQMLEAGSR
jgi:hypothetical protein